MTLGNRSQFLPDCSFALQPLTYVMKTFYATCFPALDTSMGFTAVGGASARGLHEVWSLGIIQEDFLEEAVRELETRCRRRSRIIFVGPGTIFTILGNSFRTVKC